MPEKPIESDEQPGSSNQLEKRRYQKRVTEKAADQQPVSKKTRNVKK
jgi:hypothetical protein